MAGVSESEGEEEKEKDNGGDLTYVQEQDQLRKSFHVAAHLPEGQEDDPGSTGGGLLVLRKKTQEEKNKEEEEYVQWLRGDGEHIAGEMGKDLAPLRQFWSDPSLDEGEKFLRDFILNKGHLEDRVDRLPTYHEVIQSDSDTSEEETAPRDSEDESALEEQEKFEKRFNFRFEEPDADLVTTYPRTLENSYRREDDRRKKRRKERAEKKTLEEAERKEEIRRLRNLQQKEMKEKLERLSCITGNSVESFGVHAKDLEGDFDPKAYDGVMQQLFDEHYYEQGTEGDEEKPQFSDLEGEDWNYGDQEDFNMDADYYMEDEEVQDMSDKKRKRRRRQWVEDEGEQESKDAELLEKYKHEGYLRGELFRYRQVEPNDFGLSVEEILWSDNKELNRWASLTKAVQYLTPEEEVKEKKKYQKKSHNLQKKKAVLTSCYGEDDGASSSGAGSKKKKGAGHKVKSEKSSGKGKGRKTGKGKHEGVSESRLKSYGL